jgi:hypothetical protein
LRASDSIAHAGSKTIPSSLRNSRIVEQIRFSGAVITSILFSLQSLKGISPTLATAAPSTKVSIFSSVVFSQTSKLCFMLAAHSGSTPIISVFLPKIFLAVITHDITPPHQIGAIIISTSGLASNISRPRVACPRMVRSSSKGCTNVAPCFASYAFAALRA